MENAKQRLQTIYAHFPTTQQDRAAQQDPFLVLPDDAKVSIVRENGIDLVAIDNQRIFTYKPLPYKAALVLSAVGTEHESKHLHPNYDVLELAYPRQGDNSTGSVTKTDFWGAVYALFTLFHEQEHIPIVISPAFSNHKELTEYVLYSGLGRKRQGAQPFDNAIPEIFLSRAVFWQSAGTGPQWGNNRGWLRGEYGQWATSFPNTQSFTRSPLVIAAHPLRPPKPPAGSLVYKRYCTTVNKTFSILALDFSDDQHTDAFHRFMNDELVNKGWGEKGTMEYHMEYMKKVTEDPANFAFMMKWDDEFMGYLELPWIRENHVATYIPEGALDWDRGFHLLIGLAKYRGPVYAQSWFRSATHYIFLSEPRTLRIVGEPKRNNAAVVKISIEGGMHIQTTFDFPYKRSCMTMNLRDRFFKDDMLL